MPLCRNTQVFPHDIHVPPVAVAHPVAFPGNRGRTPEDSQDISSRIGSNIEGFYRTWLAPAVLRVRYSRLPKFSGHRSGSRRADAQQGGYFVGVQSLFAPGEPFRGGDGAAFDNNS